MLIYFSCLLIAPVLSDTDGAFTVAGVSGYSGEIDVNTMTGSSLFFYLFPAIGGNISSDTRPLLIWLPGGPGLSAAIPMFGQRISPLYVDDQGNPVYNNQTWASRLHILSVDFPYGVGYSSPTNWQDWVSNATYAAQVFVDFLDILQNRYPSWINRDIYIGGEDFTGFYIPAIANLIQITNRNLSPNHPGYIDLKGIILGDPWINGAQQVTEYDTFLWNEGLVNQVQKNQVSTYENFILGNSSSNPKQAFVNLQNLLAYVEQVTGGINYVNYRRFSDEDLGNLDTFLNNPTIMQEFNAPSGVNWVMQSSDVQSNFSSYYFTSQSGALLSDLNNFNVLIYSTQDNFLINSMGVQSVLSYLGWTGYNGFINSRRGIWYVNGDIAGYVQTYNGLTYVNQLNTGVYNNLDQSVRSRDMIFRFIFNQGWN